jgi:cytochrome c oxidase subunit I
MADPTGTPPVVSQRWLLLAVGSLGLSAAAALVLALARTPGLTAFIAADAFPRALVVHVNLATLIWYFSMACAFWTEGLDRRHERAAGVAFVLAVAGAGGVLAAGLAAAGTPVLANYVPYLDSPLFIGSLACFAAGALSTALLSLARPRDSAEWGFTLARWPFLMAALYLAMRLAAGAGLTEAIWGAGHLLQFGYVALLMAIWLRLVERTGLRPLPPVIARSLFAAAVLPATLAPLAVLVGFPGDPALHDLHTQLMRWTNWPAPVLFGLSLLRGGPTVLRAGAFAASLGLLVAGALAGMLIDRQTTMIPAHYHGTIGAFTLALMAAALARVSPDDAASRRIRAPLALYAVGISLLIAGLAWSGVLGAPRKLPFSADHADLFATLAAALTGLGGAITVGGVCTFAIISVRRVVPLCLLTLNRSRTSSAAPHAPTFAAAR